MQQRKSKIVFDTYKHHTQRITIVHKILHREKISLESIMQYQDTTLIIKVAICKISDLSSRDLHKHLLANQIHNEGIMKFFVLTHPLPRICNNMKNSCLKITFLILLFCKTQEHNKKCKN